MILQFLFLAFRHKKSKNGDEKMYYNRKTIRLQNYDYSQKGMYFITICTKNRECILSTIQNSTVGACIARPHEEKILQLTDEGIVVDFFINEIEKIHNNISIREYDHIVCDEKEYFAIKQYIKNNPNEWEDDWF